jgi:hypothetical protein
MVLWRARHQASLATSWPTRLSGNVARFEFEAVNVDPLAHAVKHHKVTPFRPRLGVVVEKVKKRMALSASLADLFVEVDNQASPVTDSLTRYSTGKDDPATNTFSFSTTRPPSVSVTS